MDIRRLFLPTSSRVVVAIALLASTAVLLSVLGYWGVQQAAPRAASRPPLALPTPAVAGQAIVARHLFGRDQTAPGEAGAAVEAAIRVLGVASSGRSGGGFAIVSINGQPPVPAVEGREFAPGMRLARVTATGIEYEWGGVRHRANLPEKSPGPPGSAADASPGVADPNLPASHRGRPRSVMPGRYSAAARN